MRRIGIVKKLASLILALILMSAFYLYALLREDEETKGTERWIVAAVDRDFKAQGTITSLDPAALASAMGLAVPLMPQPQQGEVKDADYHGYYVRLIYASDGEMTVRGVRPASAAPMLRDKDLIFLQSEKTLMNYPLLKAQKDGQNYYFLSTESAAFVIQGNIMTPDEDALTGFILAQPQ